MKILVLSRRPNPKRRYKWSMITILERALCEQSKMPEAHQCELQIDSYFDLTAWASNPGLSRPDFTEIKSGRGRPGFEAITA